MAGVVGIRNGEAYPAFVLLARSNEWGGGALGMPGTTLTKTDDGFRTLAELYQADKIQALLAGLNTDLGTQASGLAVVEWAGLSKGLKQAGSAVLWEETIGSDVAGAGEAARAVLAFVGAAVSSPENWSAVDLSGQSDWMRSFMTAVAPAVAKGAWKEAVLPGKSREGLSETFFEGDMTAARAVLAGAAKAPAAVTLEVQNGSGYLEAAQAAGAILEPLGYTLAPYTNAEDFPDVATTTIMASPDVLLEAGKVRELLGVGVVNEDDALASGHIRVVLGKDFEPDEPASRGG
jgi:hypothetical protein